MTLYMQNGWVVPAPCSDHLCLQIHSLHIRRQLLEMWKSPKDGCGSRPNIYVRPDLTKTQLQTDKLLRQQLLIAGKDRFMIRRGQIVERNPSSTSTTTSSSAIQKLNLASTRLSTSGLRQTAASRASNTVTQNSSAKPSFIVGDTRPELTRYYADHNIFFCCHCRI